jgi:hypothetical protein
MKLSVSRFAFSSSHYLEALLPFGDVTLAIYSDDLTNHDSGDGAAGASTPHKGAVTANSAPFQLHDLTR